MGALTKSRAESSVCGACAGGGLTEGGAGWAFAAPAANAAASPIALIMIRGPRDAPRDWASRLDRRQLVSIRAAKVPPTRVEVQWNFPMR